jgi:hypothetical protein
MAAGASQFNTSTIRDTCALNDDMLNGNGLEFVSLV